ncbi:hypothetical protein ABZ547_08425 [Streptomyces sparsogenes]|uniref:hypothetical protein n=1 Tax=Streptomyces sparsogenes TaxID=67365 RepID=UPI0033D0717D
MREQGDLKAFLLTLAGQAVTEPEAPAEDEQSKYHIARPGAWPCGTAASGPTPGPCCPDCQQKGTPS